MYQPRYPVLTPQADAGRMPGQQVGMRIIQAVIVNYIYLTLCLPFYHRLSSPDGIFYAVLDRELPCKTNHLDMIEQTGHPCSAHGDTSR